MGEYADLARQLRVLRETAAKRAGTSPAIPRDGLQATGPCPGGDDDGKVGELSVMITEARVAFLEGRVTEQAQMFSELREGMSSLAQRMDRLDERMDRRFEQVDVRFAQVDTRFLRVEARLDQLGGEMSKNFRWIVGIQITTLITVVATLLGALAVR